MLLIFSILKRSLKVLESNTKGRSKTFCCRCSFLYHNFNWVRKCTWAHCPWIMPEIFSCVTHWQMDVNMFKLVFLPSLSWLLLCPQILYQIQPKVHSSFLENIFTDFNYQERQHPQKNSNGKWPKCYKFRFDMAWKSYAHQQKFWDCLHSSPRRELDFVWLTQNSKLWKKSLL